MGRRAVGRYDDLATFVLVPRQRYRIRGTSVASIRHHQLPCRQCGDRNLGVVIIFITLAGVIGSFLCHETAVWTEVNVAGVAGS